MLPPAANTLEPTTEADIESPAMSIQSAAKEKHQLTAKMMLFPLIHPETSAKSTILALF